MARIVISLSTSKADLLEEDATSGDRIFIAVFNDEAVIVTTAEVEQVVTVVDNVSDKVDNLEDINDKNDEDEKDEYTDSRGTRSRITAML